MFKKIINVVTDAAIDAVSIGAGVASLIYCVAHDPLNDQETSTIVGAASGAAISGVTSATLHGIKEKLTAKKAVAHLDIDDLDEDDE